MKQWFVSESEYKPINYYYFCGISFCEYYTNANTMLKVSEKKDMLYDYESTIKPYTHIYGGGVLSQWHKILYKDYKTSNAAKIFRIRDYVFELDLQA